MGPEYGNAVLLLAIQQQKTHDGGKFLRQFDDTIQELNGNGLIWFRSMSENFQRWRKNYLQQFDLVSKST